MCFCGAEPPHDIYGPVFRSAREAAAARSNGICQGCGQRQGREAHHWAPGVPLGPNYPECEGRDCTPDDLTWLCSPCHDSFTSHRRLSRRVGLRMADTVRARIIEEASGKSEAELVEIIEQGRTPETPVAHTANLSAPRTERVQSLNAPPQLTPTKPLRPPRGRRNTNPA